ncbi:MULTISPECIES: S1 family peptidase [Butyricimonas]|uniref:S1 family peptidase n=1 Tax=Butyricimonas TaxID=574697 RepID=UPI001D073FB9|nr:MULTISPECIES: serine protease [Butyricimonas]MCB6971771.1 serine protease [Butyricimonas synergistica]MCG4518621.1 serine protease [Butyricimonas sp. DFI.6.44]
MEFCSKLSCILLCCFLVGNGRGMAQEVVYRDYTRQEAALLDSLKKEGVLPLFKGMRALRQQAQGVKESTPVNIKPRHAGKRVMTPENIIKERRASVLTVNKYQGVTTRPDMVYGWATAVVLTADGVCVTNFHVFWELLEPAAKLNPADSLIFVATEDGRAYPITEILSFNKAADMAFFKIDTRGDVLTPMPLGDDLPAGANVHLLSNPEGYPYAYTHGRVSRTIALNPGDPFSRRMEMTADFAKGSSGGPIMDDRGNMVSMVSSIRAIYFSNQPPYHLQMNVKLTIPVSSLRRVIKSPKQK